MSAPLLAAFVVSGTLADPGHVTYTLTLNVPRPGVVTVDVTVDGANVPFQEFCFRELFHRGQDRIEYRKLAAGGRTTGTPSVEFSAGNIGVIRVFAGLSRRVSGRIVVDPTWYPGGSPGPRTALLPGERVLGSVPVAEATNIYVPLGHCDVAQFECAGVLVKGAVSPGVQDPLRCLGAPQARTARWSPTTAPTPWPMNWAIGGAPSKCRTASHTSGAHQCSCMGT